MTSGNGKRRAAAVCDRCGSIHPVRIWADGSVHPIGSGSTCCDGAASLTVLEPTAHDRH